MNVLHADEIKRWVYRFQNITESMLKDIEAKLLKKRIDWFEEHTDWIQKIQGTDLERAYRVILMKIGIRQEEAPIIEERENRIIFHSKNFCPSLEACKLLGLDTKIICKEVFEKPTDELIKRVNSKLIFTRNYSHIRPYTTYCEEIITYER